MSTDLHLKHGKMGGKGADGSEKVVVAVKASSREIPRTAILWALTHVVQPGACITFLVVVPAHSSGRKFWGFPRFSGDCANGQRRSHSNNIEMKTNFTDSCSQMMLQLRHVYDPDKINVKIKIVSGSPSGVVAAESKRIHASWVVLDKQLKHEEKQCIEDLQCNIVVMKRSRPKVLRLNLVRSPETDPPPITCQLPYVLDNTSDKPSKKTIESQKTTSKDDAATPTSSPEGGTTFTGTEAGTSSVSSSDPGASPFSLPELNGALKKDITVNSKQNQKSDSASSESESEKPSPSTRLVLLKPWMTEILNTRRKYLKQVEKVPQKSLEINHDSTVEAFGEKFKAGNGVLNGMSGGMGFNGNVREAVSLPRKDPPGPPPLCSICQHKAPIFGKPPRWFSYAELELATGGFSKANFLAEGGFGSVHRGVLVDGQVIAVKQHRLASSQGDLEFCSEVEVLSCAQHRNVVMLIGYCIQDKKRLLVYEYICNGSLDTHLYRHNCQPLEWSAREKIAVGAARGLRYLHEECRVGCIVHRDMRPNNILVTHDFEPLVGDFGLARLQPKQDQGIDTRVIGTFGYLAPEYAQSGQITEKADVYSFGVVLLELITARKAVDISQPKGQQCLTEWARPLLEEFAVDELLDPDLGNNYSEQEVYCMMHAASLCISHDPDARPRISQVLRILEGDLVMEPSSSVSDYDAGARSSRTLCDLQHHHKHAEVFHK